MLKGVQRVVVDKNTDRPLGWEEVCQVVDHMRKVMRLGFGGTDILTHRDENFLPAAVTLHATKTCYDGNLIYSSDIYGPMP